MEKPRVSVPVSTVVTSHLPITTSTVESRKDLQSTSCTERKNDLFSRVELLINLSPKGVVRSAVTPRDLRQLLQWTLPSSIPLVEAPDIFLLRNRSAVRHVLYVYVEGWSYDLLSGAQIPSEKELQKVLEGESAGGMEDTISKDASGGHHPSSVIGSSMHHRENLLTVALWRLRRKLSMEMLGDIRRNMCWAREAAPLDLLTPLNGRKNEDLTPVSSIHEKSSRNAVQCAPLVVPGLQGLLEKEIFWASSTSIVNNKDAPGENLDTRVEAKSKNDLYSGISPKQISPTSSSSRLVKPSTGVGNRFNIAKKLHLSSLAEGKDPDDPLGKLDVSNPKPPSSSLSAYGSTRSDGPTASHPPLEPTVPPQADSEVCSSSSSSVVSRMADDEGKERKKKAQLSSFPNQKQGNSTQQKSKRSSFPESKDNNKIDLANSNAAYWNNTSLLRMFSLRYPENMDKLLELGFIVAPPPFDSQKAGTSSEENENDGTKRSTFKRRREAHDCNLAVESIKNSNRNNMSNKEATAEPSNAISCWRWFPDPPFRSSKKTCDKKETKVIETLSFSSLNTLSEEALPTVVALDCEMVLVKGNTSALARATLVDACTGDVLVDMLVKPSQPIVNYLTRYSGITEAMLENVTNTLEDCQESLFKYVHSDSFLVGHSLENDLKACQLLPNCNILDSAYLFPHPAGLPMKNALRFLVQRYFNIKIQDGAHDSTEDAWCSAQLVLLKLKNGQSFGVPHRKSVLCCMANACSTIPESSTSLSLLQKDRPHERSATVSDHCHSQDKEDACISSSNDDSLAHWWGHFTLVDTPESITELVPISGSVRGLGAINTILSRNDDDAVKKGVKALQKAALTSLLPCPSSLPLPPCTEDSTSADKIKGESKAVVQLSHHILPNHQTGAKKSEEGNQHHEEGLSLPEIGKQYNFFWVHLKQNHNPFLFVPSSTVEGTTEYERMEDEEDQGDDDRMWLQEQLEAYERRWYSSIKETNQRVLRLVEACPDGTVILIMSGGEPVHQPSCTQGGRHAETSPYQHSLPQKSGAELFRSVPCISGFRGALFSFVKEKSAPGPDEKAFSNNYSHDVLESMQGFCTTNTKSGKHSSCEKKLPDPPACQPQ